MSNNEKILRNEKNYFLRFLEGQNIFLANLYIFTYKKYYQIFFSFFWSS